MENKIKHKILYPLSHTLVQVRRLIERLFVWLHNGPVVTYVRPIHRDIHLNSAEAISRWLAMIDGTQYSTTHEREEFERIYATKSGMSILQLHALGGHAVPCMCDEDGCKGWQMVTQ